MKVIGAVSVVVLLGFLGPSHPSGNDTFSSANLEELDYLYNHVLPHATSDADPKQMLVAPLSVVNLINTKEPNQTTPLLLNSLYAILNIFKNVTLIFLSSVFEEMCLSCNKCNCNSLCQW